MGKTVCVTGATGYIASWLVKLLLQRGYAVKATVRNLVKHDFAGDPSKFAHLTQLEGAEDRLQLYEANLLEEGSFDSAVDGCEGVFHTASPVFITPSDPQRELIDPAVKGTINVLKSCAKVSTIKRVVVTSSTASVMHSYEAKKHDIVVDETWFSDPIFCEENKDWYGLSKTLADRAARKFAEENGLDLVTLHPGFTIGPLLQPTLNFSSLSLLKLVEKGKELPPSRAYPFVDVRDVALAHILALENASASGRYCLAERVVYLSEAFDILRLLFPSLNLSPTEKNNKPAKVPFRVSKERAESLGVSFRPVEESLKDSVECFKERNLVAL